MAMRATSSRAQFADYRRTRRRTGHEDQVAGSVADRKEQEARKQRSHRSFLALTRAFWGLLRRPGRRVMIFALSTRAIAAALTLLPPALMKLLVDGVLGAAPASDRGFLAWLPWRDDPRAMLWFVAVALAALPLCTTAVGLSGRWRLTRVTRLLSAAMKRRVFEHASRLPLHRVHRLKSGGITALLREDASGVADLTFGLFYNPGGAIVQLLGTLAVLAWIDWRMLVGGVLVVPLVWYTHRTWIARIRPVWRDIKAVRQQADAHATESFGGMRVVRAFGRESAESVRYARRNNLVARKEVLAWWMSRGIDIAWDILIPLASAGIVLYGGHRVLDGALTPGDVVMFAVYLAMLLQPIGALAGSAASVQTQLAGLDRVLDVLDESREFAGVAGGVRPTRQSIRGRISVEGLWFAYPGAAPAPDTDGVGEPSAPGLGPWVLRDVSLDVRAGETIALVGPSGSGKTTLCNLVARFYDPTRGRIALDGTDLRTIDIRAYRRLLGVVEQDVFLFDGTVADNIGYARRDASARQIEDAARAAHADEFVRALERGYETLIGERGVRLSGGQKQRIAIARALLADPAILILDEATSNLDAESEAFIQESLRGLTRGRTTFVIAHRLSTVRDADRIVVLDAGRIVEVGAHAELLASGGRYAAFLRRQLEPGPANGTPGEPGEYSPATGRSDP